MASLPNHPREKFADRQFSLLDVNWRTDTSQVRDTT